MRFVPPSDPEVLVVRTTTSPVTLVLGLSLLLPGLALMASVFIPAEVRGGDPIPWFLGIPAGILFFGVGGLLAFARRSVRVDRRDRLVRSSFHFLLPLSTTTKPLDDFDHLDVRPEYIRSPSEAAEYPTKPSYAVDLAGRATMNVGVCGRIDEATAAAQKLSEFLGIGVRRRV